MADFRLVLTEKQYLDVFHVYANPRRSRLLNYSPEIDPRTEDDWEIEEVAATAASFLPAITPQQKAVPVVHCELSQLCTFDFNRSLVGD